MKFPHNRVMGLIGLVCHTVVLKNDWRNKHFPHIMAPIYSVYPNCLGRFMLSNLNMLVITINPG
jgi:hypothetical protein